MEQIMNWFNASAIQSLSGYAVNLCKTFLQQLSFTSSENG